MQTVKYNDKVIISNLQIANGLRKKMIGLLNKKWISKSEGLLLVDCYMIHTFFMKFEIDVFFLDKNKIIKKIYEGLKPYRITNYIHHSDVLETKSGLAKKYKIKVGDVLEF